MKEVIKIKESDKKKPIKTIPKGVWESSRPDTHHKIDNNATSTDLQGNGHPTKSEQKKST